MVFISSSLRARRSVRLLLALCCLALPLLSAPQSAATQPSASAASLTVLASDGDGLTLLLEAPAPTITQTVDEAGRACALFSIQGAEPSATPGAPALPEWGALLGLPPEGAAWLEILEADGRDLPGVYYPCPAPTQEVTLDLEGLPTERRTARRPDPAIYEGDALWPAEPATLRDPAWLRGLRVARLALHPVQVNPASGQARQLARLVVRVHWEAPAGVAASAQAEAGAAFEPLYRQALLNWPQAAAWLRSPGGGEEPAQATLQSASPRLKILVEETGIHRLTYAALAAAGVPVDALDPRTLALSHLGQEAALQVEGEADGVFDPEDAILFYGQAIDSPHTRQNVYWLSWGEAEGLRMAWRDATPDGSAPVATYFTATLHLEQDTKYQSLRPSGPENDRWYWNYILASGGTAVSSYAFALPALSAEPITAAFRALYRGFAASAGHRCQTRLNGALLDSATWPSDTAYSLAATVSPGVLVTGTNGISVTCGIGIVPGQYDYVMPNWFEVDYPHAYVASDDRLALAAQGAGPQEIRVSGFGTETLALYDVTDPLRPLAVTATVEAEDGGYALRLQSDLPNGEERYEALALGAARSAAGLMMTTPSDWRSPAHGADYIILSHPDFLSAIQPLAARRASQGLRVAVVNVQDVYDEFAHGLPDPQGIRDFIGYAYWHWQRPAPAYVLLVGDGHYDPKNNLGYGDVSYLPPYLAHVDPWLGETAADNRYACVDGDDIFPDLHLGRLPVKTAAETQAMVNKIAAYEATAPGDWQRQLTFVADDPDSGGDFRALSEDIITNYVFAPYAPERIYYGLVPHETATKARSAIAAAFNAGRLIINYIGHSSIQAWASPIFWDIPRVNGLTNSIYPFLVPMTCLEGTYHYPSPPDADYSSLSETAVRAANKGAIASFAPSGMGIATGHGYMHRGLYRALFQEGVTALGPATTLAKLNLYRNTSAFDELIDTYLLMGDPALRLKALESDLALHKAVDPQGDLRPGDAITYTLTYTNAGPAAAYNVQLADPLPDGLVNPVVTSSGAALSLRHGTRYLWDVATLPPGAGGVITITATISETYGGVLRNSAVISTTTLESDKGNNVAPPIETRVDIADLALTKSGPTSLWWGQRITYALSYTNSGSAVATDVRLSERLPEALREVAFMAPGALLTETQGLTVTWSLPDLAPGEGGVITVTARLAPRFIGALRNRAEISASSPEASHANNVALLDTFVWGVLRLPILRK